MLTDTLCHKVAVKVLWVNQMLRLNTSVFHRRSSPACLLQKVVVGREVVKSTGSRASLTMFGCLSSFRYGLQDIWQVYTYIWDRNSTCFLWWLRRVGELMTHKTKCLPQNKALLVVVCLTTRPDDWLRLWPHNHLSHWEHWRLGLADHAWVCCQCSHVCLLWSSPSC